MTDPAAPPEDREMEIHKPKPVHSWRELLTEIGVIVIGVAVALAAEQLVESLHWHEKIKDARRAMTVELRDDDGPQAYIRLALTPCFNTLYDNIQNAIVANRSRAEIERLTTQIKQANVTWDSVAWNTLQSSDVASHMSPDELRKWSSSYIRVPALDIVNRQENEAVVALQPSGLTGEHLTSGEAETMLAAIKRLRDTIRLMALHSKSLLSGMKQAGVTLTSEQKQHMQRDFRKIFGECVIDPGITAGNPQPYEAESPP